MYAAQEAALGYTNLEYDLEKGQRGSGWCMQKPYYASLQEPKRLWS